MSEAPLTVRQAATRLNVSEKTIRRMVADGRLAAFRLAARPNGAFRIPEWAIDRIQSRPARRTVA